MTTRSVLVSGAGIAGSVLSFWLGEAGWDVTVVECADRQHAGGYPVDLGGAAVDVVRRMGLLGQVESQRYEQVPMAVLTEAADHRSTVEFTRRAGDARERAIEISRGALSDILVRGGRGRADYVFGDAIESLTPSEAGVEVTFARRPPQHFDAVIGADGLHSRVRSLTFGEEAQFIRHLGPCVAVWDCGDTDLVSAGTGVIYSRQWGTVMIERAAGAATAWAFATFAHPSPGTMDRRDTTALIDAMRRVFAEESGRDIVDTLPSAEDVYVDTVSQIRMDRWSAGRVGLVGDAAYAPALSSGHAADMAITGAYVLASELVRADDPQHAYAAYERRLRSHTNRAQNTALTSNNGARSSATRRHCLAVLHVQRIRAVQTDVPFDRRDLRLRSR